MAGLGVEVVYTDSPITCTHLLELAPCTSFAMGHLSRDGNQTASRSGPARRREFAARVAGRIAGFVVQGKVEMGQTDESTGRVLLQATGGFPPRALTGRRNLGFVLLRCCSGLEPGGNRGG